jgi:Zn-dependent protease with chaperone function
VKHTDKGVQVSRLRDRYKAEEIPKGSFRLAAKILGSLSAVSTVLAFAVLPQISLPKAYVSLLVAVFSGFLAAQNELLERGTARATPEERARAKRLVEQVSKEMDFQAPHIIVVGISDRLLGLPFIGKRLKRFAAAGGLFGLNLLIIGTPIMKQFDDEQLRGVITHELSHSKRHHATKRLIAFFPQVFVSKVRDYFFFAAMFGVGINWRNLALASGAVFAMRQARMWVLRRHERQADRGTAVETPHGEGLASFLETFASTRTHRLPVRCLLWARDLFIPPWNSHPPVAWRVAEIRRLVAESHAAPSVAVGPANKQDIDAEPKLDAIKLPPESGHSSSDIEA